MLFFVILLVSVVFCIGFAGAQTAWQRQVSLEMTRVLCGDSCGDSPQYCLGPILLLVTAAFYLHSWSTSYNIDGSDKESTTASPPYIGPTRYFDVAESGRL